MRFVSSRVFHLTCMSSDHVPILISLSGLIPPVRKKLFRFKQMWLSNSSCEDEVFSAWGSGSGHGDGGDILRKVERCGKDLGHWEKNVFGNVKMELNRLKKVLAKEERAAMFSGNNFQVRQIKKILRFYKRGKLLCGPNVLEFNGLTKEIKTQSICIVVQQRDSGRSPWKELEMRKGYGKLLKKMWVKSW